MLLPTIPCSAGTILGSCQNYDNGAAYQNPIAPRAVIAESVLPYRELHQMYTEF